MKRTAMNHTKMKRLIRVLKLPQYAIVGILESLWHLTAREAPEGDIGKLSNEDIAAWIDWDRNSDELVSALVECKWLDLDAECRLVVHDWHEHCDDATKKAFARHKKKSSDVSADVATSPDKSGQDEDVTGKNTPALPCLALPSLAVPCLAKPETEGAPLAPEMIARKVQLDTGILTDRAFRVLCDVVKREQGLGIHPDAICAAMTEAWFAYQRAKPNLEYAWGAEKFFGEANWKDQAAWPWKANSSTTAGQPSGGEASGANNGNRGGAVGRVERSVSAWDAVAAERRAVRAVQQPVPADAGVLPASRVQP